MGESNLPSPALTLSSSPFSSSTEVAHSSIYHPPIPSPPTLPSFVSEQALQKLSSNIEGLLSFDADSTFSDILIYVSGRAVPLHRCILTARCPFFESLFSKTLDELSSIAPHAKHEEDPSKLMIDLQKLLNKFTSNGAGQVGFEAFMLTISFLYSGKQTIPVLKCIDQDCLHEACWPVVKFGIEMLCLVSVFDISELKLFWQHQLHNIAEKAQVEELLPVLVAAKVHGPLPLLLLTKHLVAVSTMDTVDLEKRLPLDLCEEVMSLRHEMGTLLLGNSDTMFEKEVQSIRKALDSDDIELVQLLLKEGRVSLNDAHALHYAASYCNPHTVQQLLELGLADVNFRDNRGLTVLHVASMRREPAILVGLLCKGANPLELTPHGRTAFQLCTRLISCCDHPKHSEPAEELRQKDRLSVEILDQAGNQNPFANVVFNPVADEKELLMRLLYLENRVAVARLLFPHEVKLVTGIAQLEATSEFTGLRLSDRSKKIGGLDLNKLPLCHASSSEMETTDPFSSTPVLNEALLKRALALQKSVELGKLIFPRAISPISNIMDDDISELSCIEIGSPEEQKTKKRRYAELKGMVAEAFRKDVAAMDRHKPEKSHLPNLHRRHHHHNKYRNRFTL